jgi:exosortase K
MKRKMIWSAQLLVVGLCALTTKLFYSSASPDDLRWILGPTTFMVELLSGRSFAFESHAGYMSSDHTFLIAASCAGVNFLMASFLLLTLRRLWNSRFQAINWWFIPAAAAVAYAGTLIANTTRICIALELQRHPLDISWLSGAQVHRLEGIIVYFGFLLLLFLFTERFEASNRVRLAGVFGFPLLVYYGVTVGIPLANGSFRQGVAFWEHLAFVITVPLLLVIPIAVFHKVRTARLQ